MEQGAEYKTAPVTGRILAIDPGDVIGLAWNTGGKLRGENVSMETLRRAIVANRKAIDLVIVENPTAQGRLAVSSVFRCVAQYGRILELCSMFYITVVPLTRQQVARSLKPYREHATHVKGQDAKFAAVVRHMYFSGDATAMRQHGFTKHSVQALALLAAFTQGDK